jgi:hypothetical protein
MKKLKKSRSCVYIIVGETGEYDDWTNWIVNNQCFSERKDANAIVSKLIKINDKLNNLSEVMSISSSVYPSKDRLKYDKLTKEAKSLDKNHRRDFYGNTYEIKRLKQV